MYQIKLDLTKSENLIEVNEDCEITAIFKGQKDSNIKTFFKILHKKPNLKSRVSIKAVLYNNSRFDFEAVLRIEKGAVGSDTYLKIDCLVMSPNAFARAVPSLEILESEVRAGHGATIGYLDPLELNYLQSKGLTQKQSENLIVEGFLYS